MKFPDLDLIGHKTDGRVDSVRHPQHTNGSLTFSQNPAGEAALELKEMESVIYSDPLHKLTEREIELLRKYKVMKISFV